MKLQPFFQKNLNFYINFCKVLKIVIRICLSHHIWWWDGRECPMIQDRKIDLALEAKELAEGSAAQTTRLAGVKAQEGHRLWLPLTRVEILNREGEAALGKPKGTYLTLELPQLPRERRRFCGRPGGWPRCWKPCPPCPNRGLFWWPAWATAG